MSKQNPKAQNNNNSNINNSFNNSTNAKEQARPSQTLNGNGSVQSKSDISGTETLDQKANRNRK